MMTLMSDELLATTEVGLTPEEKERAQIPRPAVVGNVYQCAVCQKPVEKDGFCSWHGPLNEQWLCDDHVHENRMRGQEVRPKNPMTRESVEHAIQTMEAAIKNMAMIDAVAARDASGAHRGFELSLTYKQSRPIIRAILEVLRLKLTAYPPPVPPVMIVEAEPE